MDYRYDLFSEIFCGRTIFELMIPEVHKCAEIALLPRRVSVRLSQHNLISLEYMKHLMYLAHFDDSCTEFIKVSEHETSLLADNCEVFLAISLRLTYV